MSLSSAKRVEQLFNTYFYLHSSTDIRPLPLLGLAPLSPKIYCKALPHPLRVAYFVCNGFLCALTHTYASLEVNPLKSPCLTPSLDVWHCLGHAKEQRIFPGIVKFLQWQRIVPFAPWSSPFQKHIQDTYNASSWGMWSGAKENLSRPSVQPVCWNLCDQ